MAVIPVNIGVTVTTAATRVQVTSDATIKPSSVYFEALSTNTGQIYIGDSTVTSLIYMARLTIPSTTSAPGWGISVPVTGDGRLGGSGIQLSSLYVDSSVSGEKVRVTYIYETGS